MAGEEQEEQDDVVGDAGDFEGGSKSFCNMVRQGYECDLDPSAEMGCVIGVCVRERESTHSWRERERERESERESTHSWRCQTQRDVDGSDADMRLSLSLSRSLARAHSFSACQRGLAHTQGQERDNEVQE